MVEERIKVTGRRGRRRKQLLDDLNVLKSSRLLHAPSSSTFRNSTFFQHRVYVLCGSQMK